MIIMSLISHSAKPSLITVDFGNRLIQRLLLWATIPIFKSDYDLVDFLVDISMGAAKAMISRGIGMLVTGALAIFSVLVVFTTLGIIIVGLFFKY